MVIFMKYVKLFPFILAVVLLFSSCDPEIEHENHESAQRAESTAFNEEGKTSVLDEADPVFPEIDTSGDVQSSATSEGRCFYGARTGTTITATGLEPLEKIDFSLKDMTNSSAIPTETIPYGFGVASDEKPHNISVQNQQFFDEKGFDAICYDAETDEKSLYLTFDCGYENGYTAKILDVLKEKNVKAAFFCTVLQMKDNHDVIARMINEGHIVGNHSVNHPDFSQISRQEIIDEVKGFDDYIRDNFGYSALYFRYPEGKYSENSLAAVNELGYKCVFWSLAYSDWDTENQKGASYAHDTVMERIHPGAVILLHAVSPDNANALGSIIDSARARGYEFRSLDALD